MVFSIHLAGIVKLSQVKNVKNRCSRPSLDGNFLKKVSTGEGAWPSDRVGGLGGCHHGLRDCEAL